MSVADILAAHIEHLRALSEAQRRLDLAKAGEASVLLAGLLLQEMGDELDRALAAHHDAVISVLLSGSTLIESVKPPVGRRLETVKEPSNG